MIAIVLLVSAIICGIAGIGAAFPLFVAGLIVLLIRGAFLSGKATGGKGAARILGGPFGGWSSSRFQNCGYARQNVKLEPPCPRSGERGDIKRAF